MELKKTIPLNVNDELIQFKNYGKCLGLSLTASGYCKHIEERRNIALAALKKLYRLHNMSEKIKTHLVKALILPILDYPPIPIHTLSNNQLSKLQKVQNKALRYATNQRHPYTMTTIQIHEHTNTTPLNIRLHNRAKDIWSRLETINTPAHQEILEHHSHIEKYHKDFPSSIKACNTTPTPIY